MSRVLCGLIAVCWMVLAPTAQAQQGGVAVAGWVYQAGSETLIPGLNVSLVHPQLGRSHPDISDDQGRFELTAIPPMTTPYFLEIYWGKELVYRGAVKVQGDVNLGGVGI